MQAFSSTPILSWVSDNELVDHFNSKIANVLDDVAPTKVKVVSGKKRSPPRHRIYNLELRNARRSFFSDIIAKNNNNTRALFAAVDRLTNPPQSVASEPLSTRACNEFASFADKIQKIRQAVGASTPGTGYVLSLCPLK